MIQNIQIIFFSFKETSSPFPSLQSTHECEGAPPAKQLALFFLPFIPAPMVTPHLSGGTHRMLALLCPVSPRCLPFTPVTAGLRGPQAWEYTAYVVLGDPSGIKGVGTMWVIVLTVSIINLALRQDPLGTYQSFQHNINLFVIGKSHSKGERLSYLFQGWWQVPRTWTDRTVCAYFYFYYFLRPVSNSWSPVAPNVDT